MATIHGLDNQQLQQYDDPKVASAAQKGQYQGVSVVIANNSASVFQDALEELTTGFSELKEKDLSRRKAKDALGDNQLAVDKINELMEAAFKIEQRNQLEELVNDLLSGKQGGGGALRERLRQFSDDPSEQYLALLDIRRQLSKSDGNEAILQVINQQLAQLQSSDQKRIAAGLNSLIPALESAQQGLADVADLKSFYQETIFNYQGLSGVWNKLTEQYGESRLELAADFMLKALAADYEAAGSSIDKSQLANIMADMNHIKQLSAVYDSCEQIALIMAKESEASAREIMKHLLLLNDINWAQENDVNEFISALNIGTLDMKIQVLTSAKAAVGLIPAEAYDDPEQKQQCIKAIAEVLDQLIGIEEYGA